MTTTLPAPAAPDAVVLIRGLWMPPRCGEHWVGRDAQRGDRVRAPAYPSREVEGEALVAAGPVVLL